MSILNRLNAARALVLCAAAVITGPAGAAGIQAVVSTAITDDIGTNGGDYSLFLNGSPLPVVAEQTVMLQVGDVLRLLVSAFAEGEGPGTNVGGRDVGVEFILPAEVTGATVRNVFSGSGDSAPESAYGSIGNVVDCDFSQGGCTAPGLPLSTAFTSAIQSSTFSLLNNETVVNNVSTPTGVVGGPQTLDPVVTILELTPLPGLSSARTNLRAVAQVIFNASSSSSGVQEITVTELAVIPVPAAGWLLGSALGVLGWGLRRRRA